MIALVLFCFFSFYFLYFFNNEGTENQRGRDWLRITSAEPGLEGWPAPFPALSSGLSPGIHYGLGIAAKVVHQAQVTSLGKASRQEPGLPRS